MMAVQNGHKDVVETLIQYGADIHANGQGKFSK